jgi:hypothetical protein
MRSVWILVAAAVAGCVTPRSMTLGQMAAPVGRGATEVGVFGGVQYGSQMGPQFQNPTGSTSTSSKVFGAPSAEANVQHGFNEHFALNVHASPAGVQPGLKWTVNSSRVAHFALLPAVGVGYASVQQTPYSTDDSQILNEGAPVTTTSFTFLAGLKALVSHRSGFFAGVGYDFLLNRSLATLARGTSTSGESSDTLTVSTTHQISASVGFDVAFGMVHLRPEVAFAVYPAMAATVTNRVGAVTSDPTLGKGGFGWAIFPGFSLAVVSPQRELTDEEQESEKAKVRKHRKSDGESDDDEGDEEDKPRSRSRDKDNDTGDEDAPKGRKPASDDDRDLR